MTNNGIMHHRKLVRDKIPQIIEAAGNKYEVRVMEDEEFRAELFKKLTEEAKELANAKPNEIPDELADVLQLVISIGELNGLSFEQIKELQGKKFIKNGGFSKRLFLE